ncbi:hypothetical protein Btru_071006 [Bulinus truncatus]|nr:hypothetical protein Btru_071006 [Bulinus truncatus]
MKATFNITLIRPEHLKSISNMPIIDNSTKILVNGDTYVKDVYMTTKKMSTYLLSCVIADFKYTSHTSQKGLLFRAWSRPDAVESTRLALDFGHRLLEYFEDFFNISFPLPKQDLIAMPNLAFGAMENWGLIAFKEKYMLYTEGVSGEEEKTEISMTIAHELAHMWFGNLVTPKWWDDIWLNEGFATFVSLLGADNLNPDWKLTNYFVINYLHKGLSSDGLITSHPIYISVGSLDEIMEIFDDVSYFKSVAIIRMVRQFLGVETFKKGVHAYLSSSLYGEATHDDLWSALKQQALLDQRNIDVKKVMDTWILQMNYPVVTVTRSGPSPNTLLVKQDRYLQNYQAPEAGKFVSPFNYTWDIPLTFTTGREKKFEQTEADVKWIWSNETSKSITLNGLTSTDWFLCNTLQTGFYRVNYDNHNWLALIKQLKDKHEDIHVINRAQLINDAWSLAKSGLLNIQTSLSVIDYLDKERDEAPWKTAQIELDYISKMLSSTQTFGPFQNFIQKKLNNTFQYFGLGKSNWTHNQIITRNLIANLACTYGIKDCLNAASSLFSTWMRNPSQNPVDRDLRNLIYCSAISVGGVKEWNFALEMYNKTKDSSEQRNLLLALSCSREGWILNSLLQSTVKNNSFVRQQDVSEMLTQISQSPLGKYLTWNFFKENYNDVKTLLTDSINDWPNVIKAVTDFFNTEFQLQELVSFQKSVAGNYGSGERAFSQAVEKVQSNIKWMKDSLPKITVWLQANGY